MGTLEPGLMNEAEQVSGKGGSMGALALLPLCVWYNFILGCRKCVVVRLGGACHVLGGVWVSATVKRSLCLTSVTLSSDPKVFLLRRKHVKYI